MFHVLQVVTVMLVAVALAMSLAHALELPGKMRLGKDAYVVVQSIYYPGFTIGGGVGEVGGLLASILLLLFTSRGTKRSGLDKAHPPSWTALRNRWEYSHVARAVLAMASLMALVIAISGE